MMTHFVSCREYLMLWMEWLGMHAQFFVMTSDRVWSIIC